MLTSFFSKSKPISLIVVAVYMLVFYLFTGLDSFIAASLWTGLRKAGVFILLLLSIILVNFIASRNDLTSRNAYKTILFAGFTCMLVQTLNNDAVIVSNFFVLLALRRIISLKSQREIKEKIFDATLWVLVASMFYFWSVLFLIVVFGGVLLHAGYSIKNWLLPVLAVLTVLSLVTCGELLINESLYTFAEWYNESNFDFTAYREPINLIPVAFLLALTLWASFFFLIVIQKASSSSKASLFLIILTLLVALTVAVMAPDKNTSELMFFLAPLAIVVTNYFQMLEDKWFKETLLLLVVFLPVLLMIAF